MSERENPLKHGVVVLIETQEELNLLAEIVDGVELDVLFVEEDYVVFMDDVLHVVPVSQLELGHMYHDVKPRRFMSWYKSVKRKML